MQHCRQLSLLAALFLASLPLRAQSTGEVRGVVRDARGGEPLARVGVLLEPSLRRAVTDAEGQFTFTGLEPGEYVLHISTVGYRMIKTEFPVAASEVKLFEIALTPENLGQTTSVEVTAEPFETAPESPSELGLRGSEAKNLSGVLADDPLRAVQGLPGVESNDDFNSTFSLRGADSHRIGLYLDDFRLHAPFHTVQAEPASGSLTIFNGDMLNTIDLHTGAYPVRFGDSTAGALDLRTREGSRVEPTFRVTAGAANSSILGEGPLGKCHCGDWLASVRKSYLQYLIKRISTDPSVAFGFFDSQGRVSYDLNRRNHLSLGIVDGLSGLDRTTERNRLGLNTTMTSDYHFTLANLGWTTTPSERLVLTNRVGYLRERFENWNPQDLALAGGAYGEWVWNGEGAWLWPGTAPLGFGWSVRRIRDDGFFNQFQFNPFAVRRLDQFTGTGLEVGAYAQHSWKAAEGRVIFSTGVRWDRHSVDEVQGLSPELTLALRPRSSTRIHFGWRQSLQYPDLEWLFSRIGARGLLPERANHFVAGVEQRLDEQTRVRVEFYDRFDRDLLFRPLFEPRLIAGQVFNPPLDPPIRNALRGYARGVEIFVQRRTANRLAGWISYELGTTHLRDDQLGISFASDRDQRHTANVYLSYRLRSTLNLSLKAVYGSGFPIPGFYRRDAGRYFLSESRNALRVGSFERTDFRINKAYSFDRWKITLYGEVLNIFDRQNMRFETFNGYNRATRQAFLSFISMIPVLPSVGLVAEF